MPPSLGFRGHAPTHAALSELLSAATLYCAEREWMFALYDDPMGIMEDRDPDDPGYLEADGPYRGIVIRTHCRCEPLHLDFSISREFEGSCRTQFAPFELHEALIGLFKAIEPFLAELVLTDESGLWDTGDKAAAEEHLRYLAIVMDEFDQLLHDGKIEVEPGLPFMDEEEEDPGGRS